ncbi:MAG TPA: hypothetical protein VI248_08915 [Kineosporiaceae bacterium]
MTTDLPDGPGDQLVFNGVDLETGGYLFPPAPLDVVVEVISGTSQPGRQTAELRARAQADREDHLAVVHGRDPLHLDQVGWGLVAADDVGDDVLEALAPLCELRAGQAGELFRLLKGPDDGVHAGEGKQSFLIRHQVAAMDVVDPRDLPYYLLLVGDPARLSYEMQYQLDVQYGVGRLNFDTIEEYAQYAQNVVAAEGAQRPAGQGPRVQVFAPRNPGDLPTALSASRLAAPLADDLAAAATVGSDIGEQATRARLGELVSGPSRTDVLFTATHGLGTAGPQQRELQGALLCQEWAGPTERPGPLGRDRYLAGGDLDSAVPVSAGIVFSFGCYSAGTPRTTDFVGAPAAAASADPPFVARLPQALLRHPKGGCLAFVGHVDRAWNCSFLWKSLQPRILPFSTSIKALLSGAPLGLATEYISARYATAATDLATLLHRARAEGYVIDDRELTQLWLAANDARNFVVVGDPAVRLPAGQGG